MSQLHQGRFILYPPFNASEKRKNDWSSHLNSLSFKRPHASFSIWHAVWKHVHYTSKYQFLLFGSVLSYAIGSFQAGKLRSRRLALSLHFEKVLMKATHLVRQSSPLLWDCLRMTQLVSHGINCIICHAFLLSSKAKMWQLAFEAACTRSIKPGLKKTGTASLVLSAFTKRNGQEGETVPTSPLRSPQWPNHATKHISIESVNQIMIG